MSSHKVLSFNLRQFFFLNLIIYRTNNYYFAHPQIYSNQQYFLNAPRWSVPYHRFKAIGHGSAADFGTVVLNFWRTVWGIEILRRWKSTSELSSFEVTRTAAGRRWLGSNRFLESLDLDFLPRTISLLKTIAFNGIGDLLTWPIHTLDSLGLSVVL